MKTAGIVAPAIWSIVGVWLALEGALAAAATLHLAAFVVCLQLFSGCSTIVGDGHPCVLCQAPDGSTFSCDYKNPSKPSNCCPKGTKPALHIQCSDGGEVTELP